jgi:hypothetical protein
VRIARVVAACIVVVRIVTVRIVAEKEVQTRKVPLVRNSLRSREIQVHTKWVRDTHVISSREGLESCHDSHVHCASGYQNGRASDFHGSGDADADADGADDRWSENMHNDGLVDP